MKNHKYHCCLLFAIRFCFIDMFLHFSRGLNFVDDNIRKILRGFGKKYYILSSSPYIAFLLIVYAKISSKTIGVDSGVQGKSSI